MNDEKIAWQSDLGRGVLDAAYLAAIVECSDDAIIGKDLAGTIRSWNRGAQAIFGYTAEEAIGRPIQILFPPDRLDEEAQIVERIRRGERIEHHEAIRRRKDGSDFPVSVTISPIRDATGAIVGASKILRDITERRESQRSLALNEAELRASFESAAIGKALAEPLTRRIVRANQALAHMLGHRPEALIGRTMADFVWAEDRTVDAEDYSRLLSQASTATVRELRLARLDGIPIWVRVSTTLATASEGGGPFLAVIGLEDIDAGHKAQVELAAAKRDLEQVVFERTQALADRNLLLREVYHRVKNNLQVVDGLLMIHAHKIEDRQAKAALLDMRARIFALGLVHQQLMSSPNLRTFEIAPFLRELLENIVWGAANEGVSLTVEACTLEVGLDFAVPLGLLVTEIVTNSLKHAFPGGVGTISVVLRPAGQARVVLIVSDDGHGGGQDADQDGPPASKGGTRAGVGLGIVKSLVDQLQGEIVVRRNLGTTTEISLPLPEAA